MHILDVVVTHNTYRNLSLLIGNCRLLSILSYGSIYLILTKSNHSHRIESKHEDKTMSAKQIRWAASHEWFVQDNGDGSILVHEVSFNAEGERFDDYLTFTCLSDLREWAGC